MDLLGVALASGGNSPSFFITETLSVEASAVGGFNDVKTGLLRFVVLFADHEELIRRCQLLGCSRVRPISSRDLQHRTSHGTVCLVPRNVWWAF